MTLVPTHQCFNACDYCSFREPIGSPQAGSLAGALAGALAQDSSIWLSDDQARQQLKLRPQAIEVLLLSGEVAPGAPNRQAWFLRLIALSRLALQSGRLPHTNAGPLSGREMAFLARLNPSMGLMLEGLGPRYDRAHHRAPSKLLQVRLGQLEQAGRLGIPFTTGLLLGMGETLQQRHEALELLAVLQRQWGHIQEVILQPWRPDGAQAAVLSQSTRTELLDTIAMARQILPPEVHLQLPPNLWPLEQLPEALEAGIDDLGGIDVADVINPAYPQPDPARLASVLAAAGWQLQPRLAVHRNWIPGLPRFLRDRAQQLQRQINSAATCGC